MKKTWGVLIIIVAFFTAGAQNVGIGTTTPTEKLEVNGNINVTGTIKANGTDGQPNQVLMKNNNGTMAWGDLCDYKNFKQYDYVGAGFDQPFLVPAGVTKIVVELWAGGGGGNSNGGGGAGGYAFGLFTVVPSTNASIVVGGGGAGSTGTGNASNGAESRFTLSASVLAVSGGSGATGFVGAGGSIFSYSSDVMFIYRNGQTGKKNQESYQQSSSTEFVLVTKYGNGGTACLQEQTGGEGGYVISNASTGLPIKEVFGSQGIGFGEGGGGGKSFGYPGGHGRVIIRW